MMRKLAILFLLAPFTTVATTLYVNGSSGSNYNSGASAEGDTILVAAGSPCIDAGDNSYVASDKDLAGNARIANGTVDIGCYEYGAAPAGGSLSDDLVAYYPFNGNANDASGNGYDLSNAGNVIPTVGHDGVNNGAYYFDGSSNSKLQIDPCLVVSNNFSFALWIKTSVSMSSHGASGTAWNPGNDVIHSGFADYGYVGVCLRVGTDGLAIVEHGGMYKSTVFSYAYNLGSDWHHVVVTVSNGSGEVVYLDGQYVGTAQINSSSLSDYHGGGMKALRLDGDGVGGGVWGLYTGSVDDLRIYNRALSAAEVKALYEGTPVTPPSPATYTVTFNANGGSVTESTRLVSNGASIGTLPTPSRDTYDNNDRLVSWMYDFVGWSESPYDGCANQVTSRTKVSSNTTFYAHWKTLCGGNGFPMSVSSLDMQRLGGGLYRCPIVLDSGPCEDWNLQMDEWTYPSSSNYVAPECPFHRSGYVFLGWMMYDACSTSDVSYGYLRGSLSYGTRAEFRYQGFYAAGSRLYIQGSTVLVAQWHDARLPMPTIMQAVTFDANGGTLNSADYAKSVARGEAVGALPMPTRSGLAFLGWFTESIGGEKVTPVTVVSCDMTLYAHWAAAWTVTLNANGGVFDEGVTNKVTVAKGKTIGAMGENILPMPTKTGYSFAGWYTNKSGGTKITAKTKVSKNIVYYAHWKVRKYAVTISRTGKGTVKGTGAKAYKSKVTLTAAAAKGYVFVGWYDGETLKSRNAKYSFIMPPKAVLLTAVFITTAKDKSEIGLTVGGESVGAMNLDYGQMALPSLADICGVVIKPVPIASAGATPTSVTVSGLPTGLKYDAKKKVITGVPTVAKTFTTKVAVKSRGATRTWSFKWTITPLPAFAHGTFSGAADNDAKVTLSVTTAGKISAKVGSYTFARSGWTVNDEGYYCATLTTKRKVGTGSKMKIYVDTLTLTLNPHSDDWYERQIAGELATTQREGIIGFTALRKPFGDNATANTLAAKLARLGTQSLYVTRYEDEYDLSCPNCGFSPNMEASLFVKVDKDGVATLGGAIDGTAVSGTTYLTYKRHGKEEGEFIARFISGNFVVEITTESFFISDAYFPDNGTFFGRAWER